MIGVMRPRLKVVGMGCKYKVITVAFALFLLCIVISPVLAIQGTLLSINVNPGETREGQAYTISGVLSEVATGTKLTGRFIVVEVSKDNGTTWNQEANPLTGNLGVYSTAGSKISAGKYLFRAKFKGDSVYSSSKSGIVTVTVSPAPAPVPASLTLFTSLKNVTEGQSFTLSGTLTAAGSGVSGTTVTVEVSKDNGTTWFTDTATQTLGGGGYSTVEKKDTGVYLFRTKVGGTSTYGPATSNTVSVTVKGFSEITADAYPEYLPTGQTYTIEGFLKNARTGTGLADQAILIEVSVDGISWTTEKTPFTNAGGGYSVNLKKSTAGMFTYRTRFPGNGSFEPSTSDTFVVTVYNS